MIKVFATGNIGKDAETKSFGENTVTNFSIASNKKFKDKEETTWLNCQKWNAGKLADFLTKGTKVAVTGDLQIREHDGKYYTTLNVFDLEFMGSSDNKSEGNTEVRYPKPGGRESDDISTEIPETNLPEEEGDELPF